MADNDYDGLHVLVGMELNCPDCGGRLWRFFDEDLECKCETVRTVRPRITDIALYMSERW